MRCGQVQRLVEAYVDGRLEGSAAAGVASHEGSCGRCAARIAAARRVHAALMGAPRVRAPRGFTATVMDAVYRQALAGGGEATGAKTERTAPLRMYRRLGLSFVITAGVLAISLLVPRMAYPTLVGGREAAPRFETVGDAVVKGALNGADDAVRGILREPREGRGAK
jgi:anti-sigma factor RsiW